MSAVWKGAPVLVLGTSPTALAVLRELDESGFGPLYLADDSRGCAWASRHKRTFFAVDSVATLAGILQDIHQQCGQPVWVVPTSDQGIQWLHRLFLPQEKSPPARVFPAYVDGLAARFLDKGEFSRLMRKYGDFPQPQTVAGRPGMSKEPPLPLPFFCKPRLIHEQRQHMPGSKGVIVRNQQQWEAWLARFGHDAGQWLFQEIIEGAEDNITLYAGALAVNGRLLGQFTARKLRQYPPGFGSASLVVSESLPELAERATAFLQAVGFAGLCCGEFKWCPRRRDWVVIEFNPRPSLWYGLAVASGRPLLSRILAGEMPEATSKQGGSIEKYPATQRNGVLWRYGLKDWAAVRFYRQAGTAFVLPAPEPEKHGARAAAVRVPAVFSWSDPLPVMAEWLNYARKGLVRGWQAVRRRLA